MKHSKGRVLRTLSRMMALFMALVTLVSFLASNPKIMNAGKKASVKEISITKPSNAKELVLKKGKSYSLKTKVQVKPNKKANKKLVFTSSKPNVVFVDQKGKLKAIKKGSAVITVASAIQKRKTAKLKVTVGIPISKLATPKNLKLKVGESKRLTITYTPRKPSLAKAVWKSSNDGIAKVNKNGNVTGLKAGEARVKAIALDGSGKSATCKVKVSNPVPYNAPTLPSVLQLNDGSLVTTKEDWAKREKEIAAMYQEQMYGYWPNAEDESVSYTIDGNTIHISVSREGQSKTAQFSVTFTKPTGTAPEGGWPVIVGLGMEFFGMVMGPFGGNQAYINGRGYATIDVNTGSVAKDQAGRQGAFYDIYPYHAGDAKTQTGVLMAWAWGASKVLDVLEMEKKAGDGLGISAVDTMVTGVSRCGKAAAVAGAFEKRFKVTMPVCSGYGGLTMSRYTSDGQTYNLSAYAGDPKSGNIANLSKWTITGGNEPLGSLQSSGEAHWFNNYFLSFKKYTDLPFDQHFLAAMCAGEDRYLFMVTGLNSDMWNSPPGLWNCYEEAKKVYDLLGISDHIAINMHLDLHGIEREDLEYLLDYTDWHLYKKAGTSGRNLDDLKTSVFAKGKNKAVYEERRPKGN